MQASKVSQFGAALAFGLFASMPVQALDCNDPITNKDMIDCAQQDYEMADGDLNRTYQELKASLDKTGQLKLRDAQRAWIAFRDAECARQADMVRGGTMAPLLQVSCLANLTMKRVGELSVNPVTGEGY